MNPALRVGLLGMYASRNLGDTAIQSEVIARLRARLPCLEFIGICADPEDTMRTHGIAAVPANGHGPAFRADGTQWDVLAGAPLGGLSLAAGTRRIAAVARTLDLLLMSGGGQIEDYWGGAGNQPRNLLAWTLFARSHGIPVAYFAVGLDHLSSRAGRFLAVQALRRAQFRSFRDAESIELLRRAKMTAPCRVDPDPAFGVALPAHVGRFDGGCVIVSPISHRTWLDRPDVVYRRYLNELAVACSAWARSGRRVRFVCSQITMDSPVVEQLTAAIDPVLRPVLEHVRVSGFSEFVDAAAGASLVVTSRLHGAILALVAGTPVLAISPARKVTRLMADMGLADYCLSMQSFDSRALLERAAYLERRPELRSAITERVGELRARLDHAYDDLAALLVHERRGDE